MKDAYTRKLALFGNAPAFTETLHVGSPNLGNREQFQARMGEIWDRNWLTNNGPFVQEFETRIADLVGVRHCVCISNATVALEIAIRALGLTGEVIVPSFSFVATAHALQWQQIQPVFCDIDPASHNLDPQCVERLITPRTSGIIGVHLWGGACPVDDLQEIADQFGLRLLFDAAHAFGCSHRGQMIGNFGSAEVFSFHATKFVNAFEGGAVVTNDDELAEKMRLMRNFGFQSMDNVVHVGTNGKMSEASAAMGLTSLECMSDFSAKNRANYQLYRELLDEIPGVTVLPLSQAEHRNFQYVVLEIDDTRAGLSRDQIMQVLHAENVRARRYFWPGIHRMEPYRSLYPQSHLWLPNTEAVASRVLVLPTGTSVSPDAVRTTCNIINHSIENHAELSQLLEATPLPQRAVSQ